MKTLIFLLAFCMSFAFAAPPAPAPAPAPSAVFAGVSEESADLLIGVSSNKGTYAELTEQMIAACPSPAMSAKETKGGTVVSIDNLLGNIIDLAPLTDDALYARKKIMGDNRVDDLRILFPLYKAEIHPFARRDDNTINSFSDFNNKVIGVYGGAEVTLQVLIAVTNVKPAGVQVYGSETGLLKALANKEIQAGLIVVGQPAKWAKDLDGKVYKLVPMDKQGDATKAGYTEASLNYSNLSTIPVPTIAVQVSFMTYNFKGQDKVQALTALRNCVKTRIVAIQEKRGNHSKWREIDPNATSKLWPMFKGGQETKAPPASKKRK